MTRKTPSAARPGSGGHRRVSVRLFISYSHQNRVWMERLAPLLDGFKYDERLTRNATGLDFVHAWHDKELTSGHQWDGEIRQELDRMDVFVPLVSEDFIASEYIRTVELVRAKERHKRDDIGVVPILLYDVNLRAKCSFLHLFPSLPAHGRCWTNYRSWRSAHRPIDDGLWAAIEAVQKRKLAP